MGVNPKDNQKNNEKKLNEICQTLPESTADFLRLSSNSIETKLNYGRELVQFFEYMLNIHPDFVDYDNICELSTADMGCISGLDITKYMAFLKDGGKADTTRARKKVAVSRFFTWLANNQMIQHNPITTVDPVKIEVPENIVYLTIEEQNRLLNAIETGEGLTGRQLAHHDHYILRDKALILLFLDSGMRVSEIVQLNVEKVDLEKKYASVIRKARTKEQVVYFSDDAAEAIELYLGTRRNKSNEKDFKKQPLFTTTTGERLGVRAIENLIKKYTVNIINAKKITPHKLRSSFAMAYYEASGHNILALKKKLNHKSIAVVQRYADASEKDMEETRNLVSRAKK